MSDPNSETYLFRIAQVGIFLLTLQRFSETNNDESGILDVEERGNDYDLNSSVTSLKDNQNSKTNTESLTNLSEDKLCHSKYSL